MRHVTGGQPTEMFLIRAFLHVHIVSRKSEIWTGVGAERLHVAWAGARGN
jgi:hypothetical protein